MKRSLNAAEHGASSARDDGVPLQLEPARSKNKVAEWPDLVARMKPFKGSCGGDRSRE
jgi:hypothetical protein